MIAPSLSVLARATLDTRIPYGPDFISRSRPRCYLSPIFMRFILQLALARGIFWRGSVWDEAATDTSLRPMLPKAVRRTNGALGLAGEFPHKPLSAGLL